MNEKIKWYKEVLSLEPGSRIFFPLAKLQAAEKETDEAILTLRQGLAQHPDHVEARLMLVELMSNQQSAGSVTREVDDLGSILSSYPGFWQAWSEQLAKSPAMQDASVAMRFFSETMQGRKLDWTAVIEAGLKALLLGGEATGEKTDQPGAQEKTAATETVAAPAVAASPVVTPSVGHKEQKPAARPAEGKAEPAPHAFPSVHVVLSNMESVPAHHAQAPLPEQAKSAPQVKAPVRTESAEKAKADTPVETPADTERAEKVAADKQVAAPVRMEGTEKAPANTPAEAPVRTKSAEKAVEESAEEAISLRTRTMADILADQGDFAAAAEIYQELAEKAQGEEKQRLLSHSEGLKARIGEAPAIILEPEEPDTDDDAGSDPADGSRLVDLLESLAERLEERSR